MLRSGEMVQDDSRRVRVHEKGIIRATRKRARGKDGLLVQVQYAKSSHATVNHQRFELLRVSFEQLLDPLRPCTSKKITGIQHLNKYRNVKAHEVQSSHAHDMQASGSLPLSCQQPASQNHAILMVASAAGLRCLSSAASVALSHRQPKEVFR